MSEDIKQQRREASERNLQRFINAQNGAAIVDGVSTYVQALKEVKAGHKSSHWIWYVFPQMKGLGNSHMSDYYGIDGREEAELYVQNPILRDRLVEITQAVLDNEYSAYEIFGNDVIKFRSCMKLFASVSDIPVFKKVLREYFWN